MRRVWTFVLCVMVIGLAGTAAAQSVELAGRVLDPQGAVVMGATVRLSRTASGVVQTAVSDSEGRYTFIGLTPGAVIVEVERPGFRRLVRSIVLTDGNTRMTVDLRLELLGVDETVVVTAAGVPQALSEASKAVSVFDAEDVHLRQEVTVADIIRFAPGVQVRDAGGPGQLGSLRIRGLRPEAAAVLVDGLRLRDAASTQADATGFFSNLAFVAADRVEVLRGSGSSLYGTNAVGGVVNVVSQAAGGPLGGEAQVEYGSLGATRARGSVAGSALDERLTFSGGALGWNVSDGVDGDDAARSSGGQGLVRFQIDPATSVSARYFGSADRVATNASPTTFGIPGGNLPAGAVVEAVALAPAEVARLDAGASVDMGAATFVPGRNDPDARRRSSFQTLALRLERQQVPALHWQASYQRVRTNRTHLNGPSGPGFQTLTENVSQFTGTIDTVDVRATVQSTPWLTVVTGYELEREGYFEHLDDNMPAPSRLITESRVAQYSHALAGAAQFSFLGRSLQVAVSGRAQIYRLSVPRFSTAGTVNPYVGVDAAAPPRALTGDLSASYFAASSGTKVWAHVGNAYRAPALYERFGGGFFADPMTDVVIFSPYGDPRLAPDRYVSFDGGIDQLAWRDRLRVSATVFAIDARSLTEFDFAGGIRPDTDPFGRAFGYLNGPGGSSKGLEVEVDVRPTRSFRVQGAYAYTKARTDDDLVVPGVFTTMGVFSHTASAVAIYQWRARVEAAADVFHASESYTALFAGDRSRAYRFLGFTTAGITVAYRLPRQSAAPMRVYVKVDNLFDATYYLGGWRAPGRTAAAGMSVGF